MKSGRHRVGSARNGSNGSRPAHMSVDLGPKLLPSAEAADQAYRPFDQESEGRHVGNGSRGNGHSTNGHGAPGPASDATSRRPDPHDRKLIDADTLPPAGRVRASGSSTVPCCEFSADSPRSRGSSSASFSPYSQPPSSRSWRSAGWWPEQSWQRRRGSRTPQPDRPKS